jgi:hypothetical protein
VISAFVRPIITSKFLTIAMFKASSKHNNDSHFEIVEALGLKGIHRRHRSVTSLLNLIKSNG